VLRLRLAVGVCVLVGVLWCTAGAFAAGAPVVEANSEFVTDVSSGSATFGGQVDPGGAPTSYFFEYGTVDCGVTPAACKSVPAPAAVLGEGDGFLGVSVHVQGLSPQTTYDYRLVAENEEGVDAGPDQTFTTEPVGGEFALPDGRAWELVSPPDKDGSGIYSLEAEYGVIQAAENGDGIAYIAAGPIPGEGQPAGNHAFAPTQILSKRAGGGWGTQDVQTPRNPAIGRGVGLGSSAEYVAFSSDLSLGLLEPRAHDPLAPLPETAEESVYLRDDEDGAYEALVTAENVFEGAKSTFGTQEGRGSGGVIALAGSADLRHAVLESQEVPLVEGAGGEGLYEWTAGEPASEPLALISVLPDGQTPGRGHTSFGRTDTLLRHAISDDGERVIWGAGENGDAEAVYLRENALQPQSPLADGAASGKGNLESGSDEVTGVIATSGAFQVGQTIVQGLAGGAIPANTTIIKIEGSKLILSAAATQTTIEPASLEASSECTVPGEACTIRVSPGIASYQTASSDGSRVFYTEDGELYVFTAPVGGGPPSSTVDLTEGVGVQGDVIGASENGEYVYLVTGGALNLSENAGKTVSGAENRNARGQEPEGGANLYVIHYEHEQWKPTFIANLSGADAPDWDGESAVASRGGDDLAGLTARVSPDGSHLAFMSQERITGYDNTDLASGAADQEVYEYDAASNSTVCASCNPTGERPTGIFDPSRSAPITPLLVDEPQAWEAHWLAASVPGWTAQDGQAALYQSRYLDDDGRLFFDSPDTLVPADINAKENVYEYDPEHRGDCTSETENPADVYSPEAHGCIGLISSGTSSEESAFLDASAAGPGGQEAEDVFFITSSRLVSQDTDSAYDVYDAHICSTAVPCPTSAPVSPPPSTAESCRAAPTPEPGVFAAPPSSTLTGNGNTTTSPLSPPASSPPLTRAQKLSKALEACKKKAKSKRHACETQARRTYGAKGSKK